MNSFSLCKIIIASLLVFLFPLVAQADPPDCNPVGGISERPLSDFLDTQGTTSDFLPPIEDYAGWPFYSNGTFFYGKNDGFCEVFVD